MGPNKIPAKAIGARSPPEFVGNSQESADDRENILAAGKNRQWISRSISVVRPKEHEVSFRDLA